MRNLSEKVAGIPPSATMAISDVAKKMAREGKDVISLSIGEPDFATPRHITDACINALQRGETHYAPSNGIPELITAIAEKVRTENGISCREEEVIVTCGAKGAIYEAMEAVLNPGDEVILLDPSWVSYEPCVLLAGGRPVHHPLSGPGFQVGDDLQDHVTSKTRMVVVNSPSNPSGAVLCSDSLKCIADLCEDHDLIAVSDEIYEKLVYGVAHIALASLGDMSERTITINGFSKSYAMTGWRLGYAVAPLPIIREMAKVQQHTVSHPATFAMWGGVAALKGDQQCVTDMRDEFCRRRDFVTHAFADMGKTLAPTDGAFYAFVRVGGDDIEVARQWLEEAHVAVTPGTAFAYPGWERISYAASLPRLEEAVARIWALD
jgi:aspartate aminotransferase